MLSPSITTEAGPLKSLLTSNRVVSTCSFCLGREGDTAEYLFQGNEQYANHAYTKQLHTGGFGNWGRGRGGGDDAEIIRKAESFIGIAQRPAIGRNGKRIDLRPKLETLSLITREVGRRWHT